MESVKENILPRAPRGRPRSVFSEEDHWESRHRKRYNTEYYEKRKDLLKECECCKIAISSFSYKKHIKSLYHIKNFKEYFGIEEISP